MPDTTFHVFVSHIHEEAALGTVIENHLEDAFSGRVEAFVSSDPRDNPGGDEWLNKIRSELKHPQNRMLVSVLSPASIFESWISIEAGATWILDRKVFPLCHSGLIPGSLPRPLQDFGGADLSADDCAKRLIMASEQATGLKVPNGWPREGFLKSMRDAVRQPGGAHSQIRGSGVVAPGPDRPEPQIKILQFLALAANEGFSEGVTEEIILAKTGIKPAAFKHHIDDLCHRGRLVHGDFSTLDPTTYRLGANGSKWLLDHELMPE
jgi:hypothetical protein